MTGTLVINPVSGPALSFGAGDCWIDANGYIVQINYDLSVQKPAGTTRINLKDYHGDIDLKISTDGANDLWAYSNSGTTKGMSLT
jgi:hypothetical protein